MGDIFESFAEFFAGLVIFTVAGVLLYSSLLEPAISSEEAQRIAQLDKGVTYTNTINSGSDVHDQKIGRIPGIDPISGYDKNDSGSSRMYFRPEQFIMLPAVDTDISANPNVVFGKRTIAVSSSFYRDSRSSNALESWGWSVGVDSFPYYLNYTNTIDSLANKQITFNSIPTGGILSTLNSLRGLSSPTFGTQASGSNQSYGGFNLTIDSSIDAITKKKSNSVIFVAGRVPSK